MTKVALLLFGEDKTSIQRVKDVMLQTLRRELNSKAKAGEIKYSEAYKNFYCYINTEVGIELGSILIPSEPPEKPTIKLKEIQNANIG